MGSSDRPQTIKNQRPVTDDQEPHDPPSGLSNVIWVKASAQALAPVNKYVPFRVVIVFPAKVESMEFFGSRVRQISVGRPVDPR